MFVYISLSIGSFPSKTHSGFLIGLAGIGIVICSIVCSMGLVAFFSIGMTMISGEVIPFLILAIGVDNMFIISTAVKSSPGKTLGERLKGGLTEVGPSITAAAVSEVLAFLVGTFTNIPALTTFCLQAAVAVFFDYIF
jgi:Niemann-Pick C1 protein